MICILILIQDPGRLSEPLPLVNYFYVVLTHQTNCHHKQCNCNAAMTPFFCATQICVARTCYGDVDGWLAGWVAGWLSVGLSHQRVSLIGFIRLVIIVQRHTEKRFYRKFTIGIRGNLTNFVDNWRRILIFFDGWEDSLVKTTRFRSTNHQTFSSFTKGENTKYTFYRQFGAVDPDSGSTVY